MAEAYAEAVGKFGGQTIFRSRVEKINVENGRIKEGSAWIVPATLHAPIRQDAVLLTSARDNPAATALLQYLRGDKARAVIRAYGYER